MKKTLRLILGDQLNNNHSWFNLVDDSVTYVSNIPLSPSSSTEVEYCILATDAASDATTYTFYPDITDTTYVNQAASLTTQFCGAPSAVAQTLCGSKTVADLVATGTALKWYNVATNGSALASTTAIASGTYYVTQTLNSCESDRTSVAVTVNPSAITSSAIKLSNASVHVTILPSLSNNWSVSGGLDQGLFSISNNTMLNFNSVANYNSTSSNVYLVNVSSGCTTRNLTITISPLCGKWD